MKDQEKISLKKISFKPVLTIAIVFIAFLLVVAILMTNPYVKTLAIVALSLIGVALLIAAAWAYNELNKLREKNVEMARPENVIATYFKLLVKAFSHGVEIFTDYLPHNALRNLPIELVKIGASREVLQAAIASINSDEEILRKAVITAIKCQRPFLLRYLLEEYPSTLIYDKKRGIELLLHVAVYELETTGNSILRYSAEKIITILVTHGANRSILNASGDNALELFKKQDYPVKRILRLTRILDPETPAEEIYREQAARDKEEAYKIKAIKDRDADK